MIIFLFGHVKAIYLGGSPTSGKLFGGADVPSYAAAQGLKIWQAFLRR